MKKWKVLWIAGTAALLAGCSPKTEAETPQTVSETMVKIEIAADPEESTVPQTVAEEAAEEAMDEKMPEAAVDDNFAVEPSEAEEDGLSPSRAGFILTRQAGDANIVFGLRNGELAISGINY